VFNENGKQWGETKRSCKSLVVVLVPCVFLVVLFQVAESFITSPLQYIWDQLDIKRFE
jgi:hypothetical protein